MKKTKVHVHFILDKSGSMMSVWMETIKSYNDYISKLKKDKKNEYIFSLTLFNTGVKQQYKNVKLEKVVKLDKEVYYPDGFTALYDAVCSTLKNAKKDKDNHLVIILTDGMENSSLKYDEKDLIQIMNDLKKTKKWNFVYLGANQDSWKVASKWGFNKDNVVVFHTTTNGMAVVSESLSTSTSSYASSCASASFSNLSVDNSKLSFFTEEEKRKLANSK